MQGERFKDFALEFNTVGSRCATRTQRVYNQTALEMD